MYTSIECHCPIQKLLLKQESHPLIQIIRAEKKQVDISKSNSSTFTVYTIVINEVKFPHKKRGSFSTNKLQV